MGKIISFANQKGGVGKTTSTYNVGVMLAKRGYKTLIIDFDSQASLTISANLEPFEQELSIVSVMKKGGAKAEGCIYPLQENLHIITSRLELAMLELEMIGRSMREMILSRAIEPIKDNYDFILIDCPPQLSILTINALACSDNVIIPVKTDYLSYRGLELIQETIREVQSEINPNLIESGVIATLFEMRLKDDNDILNALKESYNVIAVVKKLAIARKGIYDGLSVSDLSPENDIAKEYSKVCDYIISLKAGQ